MDLQLSNHRILVCGASSGMGRAVAEALLNEGAFVILNARREEELKALEALWPGRCSLVIGDVYLPEVRERVLAECNKAPLQGAFINAGGPPAAKFIETEVTDWDAAYHSLLRWKVDLVQKLLPGFQSQGYGRILLLESVSVKQPVPALVLSNSLRMAVVGMAKTLAGEVGPQGITVNVLAPGYHATPAVDRVFQKAAKEQGRSVDEVRDALVGSIPAGRLGKAEELASIALWLLSPLSSYVTGQTISVDGGRVNGSFG